MKILLFALNGSYSHTNLAIRCLRSPLLRADFEVVTVEKNLKDRRDDILQELYRARADVYGFSCYIWNITEMLSLAEDLKALLPDCKIVLGGPEVSFDTERFDAMPFIDHIVCGEGEEVFLSLCRGEVTDRVLYGESPAVMRDEGILYGDDYAAGEMLYYESSRGCPYRCAYCLSSAMHGVRAKTVEQTMADLLAFERLEKPIKVIKFVDRTFNFDKKRASAIWSALADEKYTKTYHFEICASLLDEESFAVLARIPKGKIQLEIGLQSTNERTLGEVSRHIDAAAVIAATERIHKMGNIHVHLDLIAGLPYETYERFKKSFNDAYFCCDMLQLGFLKLLHGTTLRRDAEKYGMVYMAKPPYTVLATADMSRDELYRLSQIADLLDRYYSSGSFARCLAVGVAAAPSPFDFYDGLLSYLEATDGRSVRKLSQTDAFRVLYGYVATFLEAEALAAFEDAMHADFSAREARKLPYSVVAAVKGKQ